MGYSAIKPKGKAKKETVAAPTLTDKPNEEGLFVKDGVVMHDLVHRVSEEMKTFVGEMKAPIFAVGENPPAFSRKPIDPVEDEEVLEPVEEVSEPAPKPKATRKKKVKEEE